MSENTDKGAKLLQAFLEKNNLILRIYPQISIETEQGFQIVRQDILVADKLAVSPKEKNGRSN
jgi:hypothetical protein